MIREVGKKKRKRKNELKLNERGKLAERCMEIDFADSQFSPGSERTYIVILYSYITKTKSCQIHVLLNISPNLTIHCSFIEHG